MSADANDLDDVVKEFLVESFENLDQLDRDLVALEKDPRSRETLASVFRTIHTIKGTCGFLGFGKLESVAHVGESLLSLLRDGRLVLDPEITTALLGMVDAVRVMLASIEAHRHEGDGDYTALIETLTRLQRVDDAAPAGPAAEAPEPAVAAGPESGAPGAPTPAPAVQADGAEGKSRTVADSTIRVDVGLLDKLMNLVGELVLARNQILQSTAAQSDATLLAASQRLNLITTELQESVMKTRMQPIGNVLSKFPRVVRDLATTCGKRVRIEIEGRETELDKTIIEAIKDPLTHVVRNSVDHGIEASAARVAAGKPAEGRLSLRAFHEGGQVNIEIADDGAGIDAERVKRKAVQRGLVTAEQAARMGDREAVNLIFTPGFSTAEKVSNISGRGVGMDVVKTNVEKIGGTVDVQSRVGEGTTIRIKIPLTLAIIPALVVTSDGDRYAIPQVSLLELVRLETEDASRGIEMIHGAPVYRLRGNLLPLVYLRDELRGAEAGRQDGPVNIVVLQADDRHFGLVVDGVSDTAEIVVKPLGKQLKGISAFAGATIMGDGRVALILDVLGLAQRAHVVSEVRDRSLADGAPAAEGGREARQTLLLLLGAGGERRMAIPLSTVARLEEFPRTAVELAGGGEVVQYRGHILPLVRLSEAIGIEPSPAPADELLRVVVYQERHRRVGLVVDRILDIVEDRVALEARSARPGVVGAAVIQQRVTDILDVPGVIRRIDPTFGGEAAA